MGTETTGTIEHTRPRKTRVAYSEGSLANEAKCLGELEVDCETRISDAIAERLHEEESDTKAMIIPLFRIWTEYAHILEGSAMAKPTLLALQMMPDRYKPTFAKMVERNPRGLSSPVAGSGALSGWPPDVNPTIFAPEERSHLLSAVRLVLQR